MVLYKSYEVPRGGGGGVPFYRLVHAYKTRYDIYDSIWIPKEFFREHGDVFQYNFVNKKLYISLA